MLPSMRFGYGVLLHRLENSLQMMIATLRGDANASAIAGDAVTMLAPKLELSC